MKCITKASHALGNLHAVLMSFDEHWECTELSGRHCKSTQQKDTECIVKELYNMKAFQYVQNRHLTGVPHPVSLLHKFTEDKLGTWINEHIENYFSV